MFNFIQKSEANAQKKLVTLKNPRLIDGLVKDEAATKGTTDSAVIENAILSQFLNPDDELTYAVANYLFEENGIARTCQAIFSYLAAMPETADDSLLPLLDFIVRIENRHRTTVTGKEDILTHFVGCIESLLNLATSYSYYHYNNAQLYYFPASDPKEYSSHVDRAELEVLKDLMTIREYPDYINTGTYFALLVRMIKNYWHLGHNNYNGGIRNWTYTYRILTDYCSLASWPCYPQYRNELVYIIKNITLLTGSSSTLNTDVPALTRHIYLLGHRSLATTEDAVILMADSSIDEEQCTRAARIEHAFRNIRTEHPYILLHTDADIPNLESIAEQLVREHNIKEFTSNKDIYVAPIIDMGLYRDDRIRWMAV